MRNWNLLNHHFLPGLLISFYFTYEELKLLFATTEEKSNDGFYFTYEELKPKRRHWIRASACGFYFTYEELKQQLPLLIQNFLESFYFTYEELKQSLSREVKTKIFSVFTLPMRNWNTGLNKVWF